MPTSIIKKGSKVKVDYEGKLVKKQNFPIKTDDAREIAQLANIIFRWIKETLKKIPE